MTKELSYTHLYYGKHLAKTTRAREGNRLRGSHCVAVCLIGQRSNQSMPYPWPGTDYSPTPLISNPLSSTWAWMGRTMPALQSSVDIREPGLPVTWARRAENVFPNRPRLKSMLIL